MIENLGEVLAGFDEDIRDANTRAKRDHQEALRRGASILVALTPVRTGEMAGSWDMDGPGLPGLGAPGEERADPSKTATINRLHAAAAGAEAGVSGIENVAPHAGFVDDGTSRQAPQAIIARAELALAAELEGLGSE